MSDLKLKLGCFKSDRTQAFFDGSAKIDGVELRCESSPLVSDIFERMLRHHDFDIAELGMTFYLRTLDLPDPPFVAIPVFPARQFRHSAIFINTSSGIEKPGDLAGKTIGEFATYGHDAGVWPKGILSDDYGVTPDQSRWVVGGTDWSMPPFDYVPFLHPGDVSVTLVPDRALGPMLQSGEIDALISALVPRCILDGSPNVARLFSDYEAIEREYYARTGIFPIMHTVVVRRQLLEQNPGLARAIYNGFCDSKQVGMGRYRHDRVEQHMEVMIPWFTPLYDKNTALLSEDWWRYGVEANRAAIDTFLRYSHEQGLAKRVRTCADIFTPELLDT
jgi:hypothetical protein